MKIMTFISKTTFSAIFLTVVLLAPVAADDGLVARDFGFGSREIVQFKEDLANLIFHDLNRDGLDDVVFVNNSLSRLEILIRKPGSGRSADDVLPRLEDVFENRGFLLDQRTIHLEVMDFNGDGHSDLLTSGPHRGIRIYIQDSNGGFSKSVTPTIKKIDEAVTVKTADFNGDGSADILVCRRDAADILYNNGSGRFLQRIQISFTANDCSGALTGDFDGDRRQDILFYFPKEKLPLRFYRATAKDGFGWEHPLDVAAFRRIKKISLVDQEKDQLMLILQNSVNLRLFEVVESVREKLYENTSMTTVRIGAKGVGRKLPMAWVVHDFNGDGFKDYCVSAPELSRLMVYWGKSNGLDPLPAVIDSLRRAKSIDVDSQGNLYVFSAQENAIACHPAGKLEVFPTFINLEGKLSVAAVSDRTPGIFYVSERQTNRFYFSYADIDGEKRSVPMGITREKRPEDMIVFPISPRQWGVICFTSLGKPSMYLWNGRKLKSIGKQQLRALGSGFTRSDIQVIPFKSGSDLMVNEGSVSRLYRFDGSTFLVERQFGLPDEKAILRFGVSAKGPQGLPGYLFYNERGNELVWFPRDKKGESIAVPFSDTLKDPAGVIPFESASGKGVLLPCRFETRWVQEKTASYSAKTISGYSSRAEDSFFWNLFPVRLGTPPRTMAAVLNAENASIELISARDGKLIEEVSFEIFQKSDFSGEEQVRSFEPREVASGDLNGDGINDLGLLVHDKLVIHLGE